MERLRLVKERANWAMDKWKCVMRFDESRFEVEDHLGDARVLRKADEWCEDRYVVLLMKWGKGGVRRGW